MRITSELIESLLWQEEDTSLDFKSEQYAFSNASEDQKSELLKDILAFANAFRRTDAFILTGVEEIKGGRSRVLGISEHLNDAHVQQFVNSKTQRPVEFSYRSVQHDGYSVGVFHIPRQERPLYVLRDFGKVKANTVYLRRGSSTAVASLDEVAQMGADRVSLLEDIPSLDLQLGDRSTRLLSGLEQSFERTFLMFDPAEAIPDYRVNENFLAFRHANANYYRDLVYFTQLAHLVTPLSFVVTNVGGVTAHDVQLRIEIDDPEQAFVLLDEGDMPGAPEATYDAVGYRSPKIRFKSDMNVERVGSTWVVEAKFGKIQPRATTWLHEDLYVGAKGTTNLQVQARLFADNLPKPIETTLGISFRVEKKPVNLKDIQKIEYERYAATPEGKATLAKMKKTKDDPAKN